MLKILLLLLLSVHGLVHLLGNARCWGWARVTQLSGRSLWPMGWLPDWAQGLAWGVAALLLVLAAVLLFADSRLWPWLGIVGLLLSQLLVLAYWPEAKWGTLANVLLLLPIAVGIGEANMEAGTRTRAGHMLVEASYDKQSKVTESQLDTLPPPVQRWLRASGVVGHDRVRTISLVQKGRMRLKPDADWMDYEARQLTTTYVPGLLWNARVRMLPGVYMMGRDQYYKGTGSMHIEMMGLIQVVDAKGPEVDQGSQLRYLAELAFYPTEVLQPYLRWQPVDDSRARVYMTVGPNECYADFTFDAHNQLIRIVGPRYYEHEGTWAKHLWQIDLHGDTRVGGIRVPRHASLTWKLPEGDFTWAEMEILDMAYNADKIPLFLQ